MNAYRCGLLSLGLALALTPFAQAQLDLSGVGGGTLGKTTTMTVTGTPGDVYILFVSINGGPTPLPKPHKPSLLDVGLELIDISFLIPGWFGTLPPSGSVDMPLAFPLDPQVDAVTFHFQAVRIKNGVRIDGKSNKWIVNPAFRYTSEPTFNSMSVRRAGYTATTLPDGKVLIAGGGNDGLVASYGQTSVDLFDPSIQEFSPTTPLNKPRTSHTATVLNDGRILFTGGADDVLGEPIDTAEVYDPVTYSSVNVGNMSSARALHRASLLPDGRVLVTGGTTSFNSPSDIVTNALKSTDIFDPNTNTFSAGPNMSEPRVGHTQTTLINGTLFIAGGFTWSTFIVKIPAVTDSTEIYTPSAGLPGSFAGSGTMTKNRFGHTAIRLSSGKVLLVGGATGSFINPIADNSVEQFSAPNSFVLDGNMTVARGAAAVLELPDGDVLISGGAFGSLSVPTPDDTIDIYTPGDGVTPGSGFLVANFQMQHVRSNQLAALLPDGTVLVAGGGEELDINNNPISYDDAEIVHW